MKFIAGFLCASAFCFPLPALASGGSAPAPAAAVTAAQEPSASVVFRHGAARIMALRGKMKDGERLKMLFALHWDYTMRESPEWATQVGYPGQNGRWSDLSPAAIARRKAELDIPLRVLGSIDRAKLTPADQLNYDLFNRQCVEAIEGRRFPDEFIQVTQLSGVQQNIPDQLSAQMPAGSERDYADILSRLRAAPELIDQTITLMREGLKRGITPPKITLREVPDQVAAVLVADPEKSPLLRAFYNFPREISAARQLTLRNEAAALLQSGALPAFKRLHEFLVNEYLPGARDTTAMSALPDGAAWYAYRVKVETTTAYTPQQLHEIGLEEVKAIHAEMDGVMKETGFQGDFAAFAKFLRSDPRFFYTNPQDLLMSYRDIAKRADPELVKLFGRLPRLPYGVIPIPDYSASAQTTAYYSPGSLAGGRPGEYYVNLSAINTRPKWEMEALSLHEAVPGHHLQISLAQEQESLPEFRKNAGTTAFVEGWALYAETLGYDMGFYKDPYSHFGALTYQMWRAVRLVVDTGMHAKGWSRQQAIDYFVANAPKSERDITVEIDRYIVWPGQALAYKCGQRKILELRARAKAALGDRFDIRKFHDALLAEGALPLDQLDAHMNDWIKSEQAGAAK